MKIRKNGYKGYTYVLNNITYSIINYSINSKSNWFIECNELNEKNISSPFDSKKEAVEAAEFLIKNK
jgi:hypothetical protein